MLQESALPLSSSLLSISPNALWALLVIVAVVFIIISSILHYHWSSYAVKNKVLSRATKIYYIVSLLLLAIATILVISM